MKKSISVTTLSLTLGLSLISVNAGAANTPPKNRISMEKARELASRVYSGAIKDEELEFEGGKWIYSFDLKKPGDALTHEVQIDAVSGKMIGMHTENSKDEKKEAIEDAHG